MATLTAPLDEMILALFGEDLPDEIRDFVAGLPEAKEPFAMLSLLKPNLIDAAKARALRDPKSERVIIPATKTAFGKGVEIYRPDEDEIIVTARYAGVLWVMESRG